MLYFDRIWPALHYWVFCSIQLMDDNQVELVISVHFHTFQMLCTTLKVIIHLLASTSFHRQNFWFLWNSRLCNSIPVIIFLQTAFTRAENSTQICDHYCVSIEFFFPGSGSLKTYLTNPHPTPQDQIDYLCAVIPFFSKPLLITVIHRWLGLAVNPSICTLKHKHNY